MSLSYVSSILTAPCSVMHYMVLQERTYIKQKQFSLLYDFTFFKEMEDLFLYKNGAPIFEWKVESCDHEKLSYNHFSVRRCWILTVYRQ